MSEYDATWEEMEAAQGSTGTGQLRRRIRADSRFDLFIAVEKPANHRAVLLGVSETAAPAMEELPVLRSVALHIRGDGPDGRIVLELRLTNRAYEELFSMLVRDLVEVVTGASTEEAAVKAFIARLEQWQRLLARSGPEGLGEEEQRGLYAELWFLNEHLIPVLGVESAVSAWTGPGGTDQDYQFPDVAIEVKSTIGRRPQRLKIASERQLDDTGVSDLFLFYASLDARRGGRQTLGVLVDALRREAGNQGLSRAILEEKLLVAGYLDAHRPRYDSVGFAVRETNLFRVRDDFPRIVEGDLASGVGDVRYSIAVSDCARFVVSNGYLEERLERMRRGK